MDAEDLVELGGGFFDRRECAVVNDHGQRELTEVVAAQFNFLDSSSELAHLRFLGIIEQRVVRGGIVQMDLTEKGSFGVVKMPALGLYAPSRSPGLLFFPFGDDVIVRAHIEKPLEQQRIGMRGGLLEREDFDVEIVHAQMAAVAFDMRLREVVIEKRVVRALCPGELQRVEVQGTFEDAECFVLSKNSHRQEIVDLRLKTLEFLSQRRFGPRDLPAIESYGSGRRKARFELRERCARVS